MGPPGALVTAALGSLAKFSELLFVMFKGNMSEAGDVLELLGLVISFRGDWGEVAASLSRSRERVRKLEKMEKGLRD